MKLMRGYRGDARDPDTLKSHGGFVPKYLLETHTDGLHNALSALSLCYYLNFIKTIRMWIIIC